MRQIEMHPNHFIFDYRNETKKLTYMFFDDFTSFFCLIFIIFYIFARKF